MSEHSQPEPAEEGGPVIRDKRRIDPLTGERRESAADADAADGTTPSAAAAGGALAEQLAASQAEALDLADQLARTKAEVYNVDQRFNSFVKRSRELEAQARETGRTDVVEVLIPVLDDIELARQHGELTGPFLAIAEKLEQTLATNYGVERYGVVGDEFDPNYHEALMHSEDPEATTASIVMVAQPGYRRGENVIRPARVGVAGPA